MIKVTAKAAEKLNEMIKEEGNDEKQVRLYMEGFG